MKEIVNLGPPPVNPYSRVVKAGGLIYLSGVLSQNQSGEVLHKGDVAAQTRDVLERMGRTLDAVGSSLAQVVSATVYLTSQSDFQTMNAAYREFWPSDPPTRTTVITDLVAPGGLIEITTITPSGSPMAMRSTIST